MTETNDEIRMKVRDRFRQIATSPSQERKFPVGPASAKRLGYDAHEIDSLRASVTESFSGVGNPLALGELQAGETVVDLGSGAGLDCILAARRIGPAGRVFGVDMTPEMIEKARRNVSLLGMTNITFLQGEIEDLPLEDATADVSISNGVLNLCADKPGAVAQIFRVLKPGGRLWMADILLEDRVTPDEVARLGTWSD